MSKLALGTAQFGQNYGISNQIGQVPSSEISRILLSALTLSVQTLDTAIAYGESEQALGCHDLQSFQVVSKLPEMPAEGSVPEWVASSLAGSLDRLRLNPLHGLLLHRPQQLLEQRGAQLYSALLEQKQQGKVIKIGVSVYSPQELEQLLLYFDFDLIQIPFNIFDQRLLSSGLLKKLKRKNIEVHVRSVFLQGLLLLENEQRPAKFARWQTHWQQYETWLADSKVTALEGCLRAIAGVDGIEKLVIGVESQAQLEQISHIIHQSPLPLPVHLASEDEQLLAPSNWSKL